MQKETSHSLLSSDTPLGSNLWRVFRRGPSRPKKMKPYVQDLPWVIPPFLLFHLFSFTPLEGPTACLVWAFPWEGQRSSNGVYSFQQREGRDVPEMMTSRSRLTKNPPLPSLQKVLVFSMRRAIPCWSTPGASSRACHGMFLTYHKSTHKKIMISGTSLRHWNQGLFGCIIKKVALKIDLRPHDLTFGQ